MDTSTVAKLFSRVQSEICSALETLDGKEKFQADEWTREDLSGGHGGGGLTRVLRGGAVFEQAGVNFSEVRGNLPKELAEQMLGERGEPAEPPFYATGVSLVIHPFSPLVPTVHANFRYLQVGSHEWFGGGTDLTPYVLFEDDARHFHQSLKTVCDRHDAQFYSRFKKWCDEYFYLPHRQEARGVGGVFFDYLGRESRGNAAEIEQYFKFVTEMAENWSASYQPIVERRKNSPWQEQQKNFQLLRRGRYVEFNLIYDRGTLFGLKTGGRTESILMSLPPEVRWAYNYKPAAGGAEEKLLSVLRSPQDWI